MLELGPNRDEQVLICTHDLFIFFVFEEEDDVK